ncbi:hypothetical protein TrRE_jg11846 [Triparma retinervis]|uniref:Uncharacterized protein n=1 Tax=Triparma retinervis TaxID=2557542 RepID=A0A9W7DWB5_9STRA|nr:hypothetical protein TrRE_jg11846 [Triparma retinervis]
MYVKYTLRGFGASDGGVARVVGLVLLCFSVTGALLKMLPRSVAKRFEKSFAVWSNLVAYLPFFLLAIVAACVAHFSLPAYISQARSFLSPSLRFCAPSNDRISAYVAFHLSKHGLSQIDACGLADLVYLPVPWLENSHVPGSTFGGIHRGARVNQIPYGDSRVAHKSALNWHLRGAPFYATTLITEKDEIDILKAENRANTSYTWIVKAGEGGAKKTSKNLVGRSVWVGENPYAGIAWLKGVENNDEKALRKTAVIDEKARIDGYGNEERREKEKREAKIRQTTDLSRTELTERFLERLTIFGVIFGSVEKWKKDLEYSADLFIPAGSRPRGGGGKWGREEAKAIEERFKRELKAFREKEARDSEEMKRKIERGRNERLKDMKDFDIEGDNHKVLFEDEGGGNLEVRNVKSEELSDVDQSSISGGGFHVFYFDFLFDDEGEVWLLDVDSMGGDEDEMEEGGSEGGRGGAFSTIIEDALFLAGWLDNEGRDKGKAGDYFERLLEGRNLEEADEMQDDKSDVYICDSYGKKNRVGSGILCNLRMRELREEQRRMLEKDVIWKSIHPSMKTCGSLLKGQGEMAMLDAAQCSATIADALKKNQKD